jgi:hypothetical protein
MEHPDPFIHPQDFPVDIPYELRDQHVFIPGKTRHGKTTLMHRMIVQDIENGAGATVLDPKGNLVKSLLNFIPPDRKDDCFYLDLKNPVPLDTMSFRDDDEKEQLVGELKYIVTKGDETLKRADAILTRFFYMLLTVPKTTFLDTHKFFANRTRQEEILTALKPIDPERWAYWKQNFPSPEKYDPILTRMAKFVEHPSLQKIFGLSDNPLSIPWIMDNRKILLVNLGGSGESKDIYGSLLVAKFLQATLRRGGIDDHKVIPHHLYVDEFERFQTSAFDEIFSVAGGLGLRLVVGNQFIGQLEERIRRSLFGNAGTFIVFKIGEDTNLFKNAAYPYDHNVLARIPKYQAMYKIGDNTPVFKWTPPPLPEPNHPSFAQHIIEATSARFGPKRIGGKHSCNTGTELLQLEEDDEINRTEQPEDIPPDRD